jgi:hypothetical protein
MKLSDKLEQPHGSLLAARNNSHIPWRRKLFPAVLDLAPDLQIIAWSTEGRVCKCRFLHEIGLVCSTILI